MALKKGHQRYSSSIINVAPIRLGNYDKNRNYTKMNWRILVLRLTQANILQLQRSPNASSCFFAAGWVGAADAGWPQRPVPPNPPELAAGAGFAAGLPQTFDEDPNKEGLDV